MRELMCDICVAAGRNAKQMGLESGEKYFPILQNVGFGSVAHLALRRFC
jgi:hypothetical protein